MSRVIAPMWLSILDSRYGFAPPVNSRYQLPGRPLGVAVSVALNSRPGTPLPNRSIRRSRSAVGHQGGAVDGDGIGPAVAAAVDPDGDLAAADVDQVGGAVAVDVADQDAGRVVAERQRRGAGHGDPLAAVAVSQVGPVLDDPVVDVNDVLQAVAGHVGPGHPGVGERDVGEDRQAARLDEAGGAPAGVGVAEEAVQAGAGADGVGDAVAGQVDQVHLRVVRVEAGRDRVGPERCAVPGPGVAPRVVPGGRGGGHHEVEVAVTVGVGEPDAGLAELDSGGGVRDGLRHRPVPWPVLRQYRAVPLSWTTSGRPRPSRSTSSWSEPAIDPDRGVPPPTGTNCRRAGEKAV